MSSQVEEQTTTLEEIQNEVARMDPNLARDDDAFLAAVMLLSALVVGPRERKLIAFTGIPQQKVRLWINRLWNSGVFTRDKVHCAWLEENGSIAFWMDVSIALGFIEKARHA